MKELPAGSSFFMPAFPGRSRNAGLKFNVLNKQQSLMTSEKGNPFSESHILKDKESTEARLP